VKCLQRDIVKVVVSCLLLFLLVAKGVGGSCDFGFADFADHVCSFNYTMNTNDVRSPLNRLIRDG
jgi:hypothetical protein